MRRFELVEGKSAKFWQAEASGTTFVVEYGRLGTNGQRKEKDFPTEDAARRELEKKITEKLREGYSEVAAGAAATVPKGAKGAEAASAKLNLPARFVVGSSPPSDEAVKAAIASLDALAAAVGKRSFVTGLAAKRAKRALRALSGAEVSGFPTLALALDRVLDLAVVTGRPRLSLGRCLELLSELPTSAFERAVARWSEVAGAPSGVALLTAETEALGDAELAYRLCSLLLDREGRSLSSGAGWRLRMGALLPHLQAQLARKSSTPKKHLAALDANGDGFLAARIADANRLMDA